MQDEINKLQEEFTEDLATSSVDSSDQLAMQSSLTVLAERMATIHMKASGKQQLLEVVSLFWNWKLKKKQHTKKLAVTLWSWDVKVLGSVPGAHEQSSGGPTTRTCYTPLPYSGRWTGAVAHQNAQRCNLFSWTSVSREGRYGGSAWRMSGKSSPCCTFREQYTKSLFRNILKLIMYIWYEILCP